MKFIVRSGCCFLIIALLFSDLTASHSAGWIFRIGGKELKNSTFDNRESAQSHTIWHDEIAVKGKRYELNCKYEGTPSAPIIWSRHGKRFEPSDRVKESKYGQSLIIESVVRGDLGSYTCGQSSDEKSIQSYSIFLEIEYAPYHSSEPYDEYANLGETVTLKCFAVSWPRPAFEWTRHGRRISSNSKLIVNNEELYIKDLTEEDIGAYGCNATNPHGYIYKDVAVHVPPIAAKIVEPPTDVVTVDGKIANMTCQVFGAPMPEVQWMKDGEELIGGRFKKMNNGDLQIHDVRLSDAGEYRCEATNRFGTSAASARLAVKSSTKIVKEPSKLSSHSSVCSTLPDVPFKNPDNVETMSNNPTNLIIKWTVMPPIEHNAPKFMYRVYYKLDVPGEKWIKEDIHDWKINQLIVFNQPTYQRYKIMVGAINEKGETWESPQEVIGYSGEDIPQEAPGNFTLEKIVSGTTALLSWTKVPDEAVRGKLRGYRIETWNEREGEQTIRELYVNGADTTSALVDKFVPNTKNYVIIRAVNGLYDGVSSNRISFETSSGKSETSE